MAIPTLTLLLLPIIYYFIRVGLRFNKHLTVARESGIPYIVSPAWRGNQLWLTAAPLLLRLGRSILPASVFEPWAEVVCPDASWHLAYWPFQLSPAEGGMGVDSFMVVSPEKNMLITADAGVITQITTTRKAGFSKPIKMYKGIQIYGDNIVTTDGREWRRQRRITAPPFGEKNNKIVWKESVFQANEMVQSWFRKKADTKPDKKSGYSLGALISSLSHDSMRLSLHVISRAGFDVRLLWPGQDGENGANEGAMKATDIPPGHSMSYMDSLESLLLNLIPLFIFPKWSLKYSPFSYFRNSFKYFTEWGQYMQDIYSRKTQEITNSKNPEDAGMDLMGAMIRHSGQIAGTPNYGKADAGMSKEEIFGNSFILFLAGHETAANSIHFAILYMAMKPSTQRKLQAELDLVFKGRKDPESWSYDTDLPQLFNGYTGAVMNEQLRLIPPVNDIPKSTRENSPQPILINDKEYIIPADTHISINAVAVHRNPKYWPCGKPRKRGPVHPMSNLDNDLEEFCPDRWLLKGGSNSNSNSNTAVATAANTDEKYDESKLGDADTGSSLYHPPKGAYIPFSDGARACLGRRFAQVEILATLAVIYSKYSIELSVDEWVSDEEVQRMSKDERRTFWRKARDESERKLREEMGTIITLQFRGKGVKLRVCERGNEWFDFQDED